MTGKHTMETLGKWHLVPVPPRLFKHVLFEFQCIFRWKTWNATHHYEMANFKSV